MKRFFNFFYRLAFWASLAGYLICAASSYLAPSVFSFTDVLALGYPFALGVLLLFLLINLLRNRRRGLLVAIVILAGFRNMQHTVAFHPFTSHQQPAGDCSFRVLTWNVFFFLDDHEIKNDTPGHPRRAMLDLIHRADADVLCFQEYWSINGSPFMVSINRLLDSMGYKYRVYSGDKVAPYWAGGISEHGTVLFSKLPVLDSGRVLLGKDREHAVYADVLFQQKKLRVYAAHLSSLGLYTDTAKTPAASENVYKLTYQRKGSMIKKINRTARRHEIEALVLDSTFRNTSVPFIFCADMNSTPATYNYHQIRGSLQDAFLAKGFGLGNTYYGLSPTLRIDVCFADKRLLVTDCYVNKTHLSDHYPVISSFRWRE